MKREDGSATVLTILLLPVMILSLALVADVGQVLLARHQVQAAADLAALAACQELDPDRLRHGELVLVPDRARATARDYALGNLERAFPGADLSQHAVITVAVHNPTPWAPGRDLVTGRELVHPTVCLLIDFAVPLRLLRVPGGRVWIRVHADASVVIP